MDSVGSSSKVLRPLLWVLVFCVAAALAALLARNDLIPFFMTGPSLTGVSEPAHSNQDHHSVAGF